MSLETPLCAFPIPIDAGERDKRSSRQAACNPQLRRIDIAAADGENSRPSLPAAAAAAAATKPGRLNGGYMGRNPSLNAFNS
mmetsp:Transcript_23769/g.42364  ORF Transcript_23769/g.42364 Transcript_23769/m.42364 type:complete len:82 (-) Transcript_23769:62-307(-)